MKRLRWLLGAGSAMAVASALMVAAGGAGAASTLPTINVALNGTTVVVTGQTVSGAVNVVTTVTGKPEPNGGTFLFRLNPGESPSVFTQAAQAVGAHNGDLNYLEPYGSIVFDSFDAKGTSSAQTSLTPGNYLALDINTTGKGVPPHTFFTVTQSATPAALPAPAATISTIEFGFTGPKTVHEGEVVRFQNDGFLVHMDVWEQVKTMAAAKEAVHLLLTTNGNGKKLNSLFINEGAFANPISTGGIVQETITEKPGIYVQDCFMDTQDGRSHTQLGMERIIKVVK